MKIAEILDYLFPQSWQGSIENAVLKGTAKLAEQEINLVGCVEGKPLTLQMTLALAESFLNIMESNPNSPIFLLVDTSGQAVSHSAELLGINRYYGHLCKTIHAARHQGHQVVGLVIGQALGGAFLATALDSSKLFALPDAKIAVMWLEAMAKVTKIPLETLQNLSKTSAIFAPGASNFEKLGALSALSLEQFKAKLPNILATVDNPPSYKLGAERGGRVMAEKIIHMLAGGTSYAHKTGDERSIQPRKSS